MYNCIMYYTMLDIGQRVPPPNVPILKHTMFILYRSTPLKSSETLSPQ